MLDPFLHISKLLRHYKVWLSYGHVVHGSPLTQYGVNVCIDRSRIEADNKELFAKVQ